MESQYLSNRYINKERLETLLRTEFGSQYTVEVQEEGFLLTAPRQLSEAEVSSITRV